ncbi:c-type cytochrome biogenesis protein CcmI [Paracoccus aurantiacus]|uniref:C-type cytochrome biogenesis protein CcmI n=1 Tax=Paracoccus aurantiacus TaxID=2599412 RepID=A0A5C6S6F0_9RHOB|nr:c-type cytochrome biogenesis protein CcmI [Paracoccus aurantiacus]TXB69989.1 c-type cytochrome biogenesis protein CcmI [Paracoccus aurantiacus]
MFWLFASALTLLVATAILWPFLHGAMKDAEPAAAYDLRVYRDQLAEVDRDLSRGIIEPAEAERLRTEIGRKVLDADKAVARSALRPGAAGKHTAFAVLTLLALIAAGAALYLYAGSPGIPDMPLSSRIESAEARYASRPSQAEAVARVSELAPTERPLPDQQYQDLMRQLRDAVSERPDDPQGLSLLARNEARLGNLAEAQAAQTHLIEVLGDKAAGEEHAFLAGIMTEAAGGLITPEAEAEIARALRLDPQNPQARYMTGLLQAQNGRPDRAFPVWASLLADSPPDSPWAVAIRKVIGEIAWLAGRPDYTPPAARLPDEGPPMPGPDADTMAAAAEMSPDEQNELVRGMVSQLEARLGTEGGTPEEWARLISSLGVLGETDHAREIYSEAQQHFADAPEAMSAIADAARKAGVAE